MIERINRFRGILLRPVALLSPDGSVLVLPRGSLVNMDCSKDSQHDVTPSCLEEAREFAKEFVSDEE